jgi:demethylphylloquinol methyltransferase
VLRGLDAGRGAATLERESIPHLFHCAHGACETGKVSGYNVFLSIRGSSRGCCLGGDSNRDGKGAMKSYRRSYYNFFSRFYDRFVALHSSDAQSLVRRYLSELVPVTEGERILDICTGTGSLLPHLRERVGPSGSVVGVDFSRGMLTANRRNTKGFENIHLVEADAASLPFAGASFDAVTCSHAFYELKGETQERTLREILRVLKPGRVFVMMEHDVPENSLVRALFYIRMISMGTKRALSILKHERSTLLGYFSRVEKVASPSGRSKIMICRK